MAFARGGRGRVLLFVLIAGLTLGAAVLALRAATGDEAVAKKGCPRNFIPAELDIANRYERYLAAAGKAKRGSKEAEAERARERQRERALSGIAKSRKYCMSISRPEMPEDIMKFGEAASLRFGGEQPGQIRSALRQKARLADSSSIEGASGTWQPLGKGPLLANDPDYPTYGEGYGELAGRISEYAYDPRANRLWATFGQGGVWESTDRGKSWFVISDGKNGLPIQSTSGIGWTPAGGDGGTLIVVTGDHAFSNDYAGMGAYYTTDDGRTWQRAKGIPDGALSFEVDVDPTNPRRVYAATGLGLYRSDDAGRTFENVNLPTGDCAGKTTEANCFFANIVTSVEVQAADKFGNKGGAVLATVGWRAGALPNFAGKPQSPGNGLYRSDTGDTGSFAKVGDDSGITPADQFGRAELDAVSGPGQNSNYVYAIVQNTKYFNDGNDLGDPDVPACDPLTGAVCPSSGSVVDGVYSSSDFGKTWSLMQSHDEFAQDPTNGSELTRLRPLGISAGVQVWYNEWIKADPTQATADGVPTRLLLGMEEVWQNAVDGQPMDGKTRFEVIGPYASSGACIITLLADPCKGAQQVNPQGNTTHPDQHGAIILPAEKGSDLIVGNDGGNYVQHSDGGPFTRSGWGPGNQTGLRTLLPYGVAMAKDRTVWAGLQDNGQMKIEPNGRQVMAYGGDGLFTLVNPDNSNEVIEEYPGASISASKDGGKTWSDMSPTVDDPDFVTPLVQDPDNYKHVITGGRQIVETDDWLDTTGNCSTRPGEPSPYVDCQDTETDWKVVYDLGTQKKPGDVDAAPSEEDPGNHVVSLRARGANIYAGFCGSCDPVKKHQTFRSGIATNVGGSKPPKFGTPDGWHVASAKGLPQRIILGIEIDPQDPKTVYVALGASGTRYFAPLGSLGEDASAAKGGYVYVSHDAGETFTDITGNLPKIQATWIRARGGQLVVATAVGMFISKDANGKEWAELGSGLPTSPVYSFESEPGDPNKIVVASFGRGVWEYDFRKRAGAAVLGDTGRNPCQDKVGPTSRFYRNIRKAAKRTGRGLVLAGTSSFRKCKGAPAGKVKRVTIALKLQVSKKRCRFLTRSGRLSKAKSCKSRLRYFTARGTTKWRFRVRGPLPNGRYVAYVRGRDNLGNTERLTRHRNFRHFRLRSRAAISGWHGRQPNTVR